jgi:hypothetical protein
MSGRISTPFSSVAVVGTMLFSGAIVGPRSSAHAESCLTETPPHRQQATGTIDRIERINASAGTCAARLSPLNTRSLEPYPKQRRPHALAPRKPGNWPRVPTDPKENASSSPRLEVCSPSEHCLITIAIANKFQQVLPPNKANAPQRRAFTIENINANGDSCWVYPSNDSPSKKEAER